MKLHLGCFDLPAPGWHNTDITPHLWIARIPLLARVLHTLGLIPADRYDQHRRAIFRQVHYLNIRKRFPFPDGSVEAIFASHTLEHLFADEARHCLKESLRVHRTGGVIRVVVPDLDRIVAEYNSEDPGPFLHRIFEVSDRRSLKNVHHWHYNATSLIRLLRDVGFSDAYRCEYREGRCPDLEILDNRPEESLYVEALK